MTSKKKPSYTALLKEVRKLRRVVGKARVEESTQDIAKLTLSDDILARVDTARLFDCNRFDLRPDYAVAGRNAYRVVAIVSVEAEYVD